MKPIRNLHESDDMTSMVDVTFLLLIFFMVTASFVASQAIPMQESEQANSLNLDPPTDLRVIVDEYNQIYVDIEGEETPVMTQNELRTMLRGQVENRSISSVSIAAHEKSQHRSVIQICDASCSIGVDQIQVNPFK